jgi:hypothetical protein
MGAPRPLDSVVETHQLSRPSGKYVIKTKRKAQFCHLNRRLLANISGKAFFLAGGMPFELPLASNNIT